jgi:hypothetical protein
MSLKLVWLANHKGCHITSFLTDGYGDIGLLLSLASIHKMAEFAKPLLVLIFCSLWPRISSVFIFPLDCSKRSKHPHFYCLLLPIKKTVRQEIPGIFISISDR